MATPLLPIAFAINGRLITRNSSANWLRAALGTSNPAADIASRFSAICGFVGEALALPTEILDSGVVVLTMGVVVQLEIGGGEYYAPPAAQHLLGVVALDAWRLVQ